MLELHQISHLYGTRLLLNAVSLQVHAGEIMALLGPSGSGKSTLLSVIAGLQEPQAGQVCFDGQDITAMPPEQRRFALMFQDFALFAHLNVQDNVAFGLIEQRIPRHEARAQALAMLTRFGLADHDLRQTRPTSGGEQQPVAPARALNTQPRLLLLDEPFSALDADLRSSLRDEFKARIQAAHMPCVLVTHDAQEAQAMATHAVTLKDGVLVPLW